MLHGDTVDLAWSIKWTDHLFKSRYVRDYYSIPDTHEGSYLEDHYLHYREQILELLEEEVEKGFED